jgi:hypothetical protein
VGDATRHHLALQRAGDGLLTTDFRKRLRSPRAVQCLIAHLNKPPGNSPFSTYILTDFSEKQKGEDGKKYKNHEIVQDLPLPRFLTAR